MALRPLSGKRRSVVFSAGLALTVSLGLLPGASAAAKDQPAVADGPKLSYVVNTAPDRKSVRRAEDAVRRAGGTVVTSYREIGVVIAHSRNSGFGDRMRATPGVDSAGATRTAPIETATTTDVGKPEYVDVKKLAKAKSSLGARGDQLNEEPLESLQWALPQINADKAHAISQGSRDVTVAVIDTGVDDTHPDLAPNFSAKQSANCVGGVADTSRGAWRPYPDGSYHGTHVAGIVAAARNGVGIAGAAPGVQVSSIKVSEPGEGFFYTEAVVCAFMFASKKGVEITNNSYYIDPWLFTCTNDPDQKALVDSVSRAINYSRGKGTAHVTSAGNSYTDLAASEVTDRTSPNDSTPVERKINPRICPDMPTQLPGVISVSATGSHKLKSYYSNYGTGQIDVAAPGGDARYQLPPAPGKHGGVLSTMPDGEYAFLQGTSMAGPYVAGVAALIKSKDPKVSPQELAWRLKAQAMSTPCPDEPYDPSGTGQFAAQCTGTEHVNNFYGYGIVDALAAVRR
ncbi:S8 family serine peptidase [Streptomyces durbertensis]|uniref:S8 family serine peptidase n=1 Tax=Streptomyces durbertensis TaxID=2448886 RepID=A0ABR6EC71_9ACTN|nr:S8 family serine peptidase [Streptomyces durbertensis]MBB1242580.1 S8 family serine peptidase [Streptomyces durbertensis]